MRGKGTAESIQRVQTAAPVKRAAPGLRRSQSGESIHVVVDNHRELSLPVTEERLGGVTGAGAHGALWAKVESLLVDECGQDRYTRWLASLQVLSTSGDLVRFGVPNTFVKDWLEERYLLILKRVLEKVAGQPMRVVLSVNDASPCHASAREQRMLFGRRESDGDSAPASKRSSRAASGGGAAQVDDVAPLGQDREATAPRPVDGEPSLETFVVSPVNRFALDAVREVLAHPGDLYNPLFVHGPTGVGKTHLLKGLQRTIRQRARAGDMVLKRLAQRGRREEPLVRYVTAEDFCNQFVASLREHTLSSFRRRFRAVDVLIVDDVDALAGKKKTQEELLHTYKALVESSHQVVLASSVSPGQLSGVAPALASRFLGGLPVRLGAFDAQARLCLLEQGAKRLSIPVAGEALKFVADTLCGNGHELNGVLSQLKHHCGVTRRGLDLAAVKEVVAEHLCDQRCAITLERIGKVVSGYYNLTVAVLQSSARTQRIAFARRVAMYLGRRYTSHTAKEVAAFFCRRSHSAVRDAERFVAERLPDPHFARTVESLCERLED